MIMEKEPLYMSTPTFRNYDDYHDAYNYYKGWNDAMHFIFDSPEEKRKKLHEQKVEEFKKRCEVIEGK